MRIFFLLMMVFTLSGQVSMAEKTLSVESVNYPTLWESDDPVLQYGLPTKETLYTTFPMVQPQFRPHGFITDGNMTILGYI